MKNQKFIKLFLVMSMLFTSSCASKIIRIDKAKSSEIKNKEFAVIKRKQDFQDFTSSSFATNFLGIWIPYGIIWFPKIKGKNQAVEFNLQDTTSILQKSISDILDKKYKMKYVQSDLEVNTGNVKKLSEIYKEYPYVVDVSTKAAVEYVKFDDHKFFFVTIFNIIDTKKSEIISNIPCSYSSGTERYYSKEYFFSNNAKNLKEEISKGVNECVKLFEEQI